MNFEQTIEPFITTDDLILQEFVAHTLHDYPTNKSRKWTKRLLLEAINKPIKAMSILSFLKVNPNDEDLVNLLIEARQDATDQIRYTYERLLIEFHPRIALKHQERLTNLFQKEDWRVYEVLENGTEEDVWEEYFKALTALNAEQDLNYFLYQRLKKIAYSLFEKKYITEEQVLSVFAQNLQEDWFDYNGYIAVYLLGLMKMDQHADLLASLLTRDDDILIEETAEALISFQTDKVVEATKPYLLHEDSLIFAASVIENIKTEAAVEALRDVYHQLEGNDVQGVIFEALVHQLSVKAQGEIEEYVSKAETTILIDKDQLAYSYFNIVGIEHPRLEEWKSAIEGR
ncbi:HEAT repeat domain-containing protein [Bacillus sp. AFS040349]|uniref:HEAT repeat domain-containing protein n=1 Tax=Bacillus sp. AFS040349 TaxID=2033502 RepID=UPI000BFC6FD8|nr:HEAT repeat domain-containing protein [Bacillus sp. AFS040349]PGT90579.1 zinc chelation protein SecC [Bacillus sp. AFS040349]